MFHPEVTFHCAVKLLWVFLSEFDRLCSHFISPGLHLHDLQHSPKHNTAYHFEFLSETVIDDQTWKSFENLNRLSQLVEGSDPERWKNSRSSKKTNNWRDSKKLLQNTRIHSRSMRRTRRWHENQWCTAGMRMAKDRIKRLALMNEWRHLSTMTVGDRWEWALRAETDGPRTEQLMAQRSTEEHRGT